MRLHRLAHAAAVAVALFSTLPAQAIDLIAIGKLSATATDFSGQSGTLENGVRGDLLGGVGSGLTWAGGSTFLALPDRGPNATAWNASVDDTSSYIPRFHTMTLALTPVVDNVNHLPYTLSPSLLGTTLLSSAQPLVYGGTVGGYPATPALNTATRFYFSGRSDNFDASKDSLNPLDARFDPEGIRLARNGKTVFISDEYGPFIHQFDRATGVRGRSIALPAIFGIAHKFAHGADEYNPANNTSGRVTNKGMEGLAISPDGKTLFGFMQSPLLQDGGDGGRANRILKIDLASGAVNQYVYDNYLADKAKAYNSSEVLALNSHELLVLERDGKGLGDDSKAVVKRIYKVDLTGAQDVSGLSTEAALLPYAVPKTLFLDIFAKLKAAGIADTQIPAKLEGMTFGADVTVGGVVKHTLYIGNDNDFLATTPGGLSNPNQWFVFTFTADDLGGSVFENQIVPAN
jgi:hypothetical protein